MLGGHLLSPDRWFWAVLTAHLLFINVRSRGETIFKGVQRLWGALAGLAVGLLVSFTFARHPSASLRQTAGGRRKMRELLGLFWWTQTSRLLPCSINPKSAVRSSPHGCKQMSRVL